MTLEEAERRIVERMTPAQRAEHERGCMIVDFYMGIATDGNLPAGVRTHAREKLRAFAVREPHQTVASIDGPAKL